MTKDCIYNIPSKYGKNIRQKVTPESQIQRKSGIADIRRGKGSHYAVDPHNK